MSMVETWRAPPPIPFFDATKALRLQTGLLSPLWFPMAAAAAMGAATWGFTRWMRLAAPESVLGEIEAAAPPPPTAEPEAEIEAVSEPADPSVIESVVAEPDPVAETPILSEPETVAVAAALAPTPVPPEVLEATPPKAGPKASGGRKSRPTAS